MNALEEFVDRLLAEKGIVAEPAIMEEYHADVLTSVNARLNAEMMELLSTENVAELNVLLDADPEPEIVREFFLTHIPNYQDVFTRTLADFRASYLR